VVGLAVFGASIGVASGTVAANDGCSVGDSATLDGTSRTKIRKAIVTLLFTYHPMEKLHYHLCDPFVLKPNRSG
jgi:hypothetical protein